jgi:glycosyltransferase involved in cell wall biosynthesis
VQQSAGTSQELRPLGVGLLTGGGDRPYALGLAMALVSQGVNVDFIGSDELVSPELLGSPQVNFLNLRRNQSSSAGFVKKAFRVLAYYGRLVRYAACTRQEIFHILWNNKFQTLDRTALMIYYRALGKRLVLTVHNVNAGTRDGNDSWLNRATLRCQYALSNGVFVHTNRMKTQLREDFHVPDEKIAVVPFGINNTVRNSSLTHSGARHRLGLQDNRKVILFFGGIAPYKGLEYLIEAFAIHAKGQRDSTLVIAGNFRAKPDYRQRIESIIARSGVQPSILQRFDHIPDDETEVYFKASDILVLPYTHVFQSGVLFLGYSFGLPVIVSDVGSLREDVVEGKTGFVFQPKDTQDLARAIRRYFESNLYRERQARRQEIRDYANARYSWTTVGQITCGVYARLCKQ